MEHTLMAIGIPIIKGMLVSTAVLLDCSMYIVSFFNRRQDDLSAPASRFIIWVTDYVSVVTISWNAHRNLILARLYAIHTRDSFSVQKRISGGTLEENCRTRLRD